MHDLVFVQALSPYVPIFWIAIFSTLWFHLLGTQFLAENFFIIVVWIGVLFSNVAVSAKMLLIGLFMLYYSISAA